MPLSQQADNALRPIDNGRKEIRDITTKHTHVEGCRFSDSRILAPQHDFAMVFMGQPNSGFDHDRPRYSSHPTELTLSDDRLQMKCLQDIGTEDGAVSASIHQQRRLDLRAIIRLNLRLHHGAYDAIIAHMPRATDQHRSEPSFHGESGE